MNKQFNFEDTIFILNIRIRMIRDLMRLNTEASLFYGQTMGDLEFINSVMNILTEKFMENMKFLDREAEADNILDTEWQFSQILNEVSNNSSPFSTVFYPEMPVLVNNLRKDSLRRQKQIEDSYVPTEHSAFEPVVSNAEINGLWASP